MEELISVVMSTYNETDEHLEKAINSILNQTYEFIEFIIVLDNPKNERIYNILKKYSCRDSRIKLIINDKNIGLTKSLNKAISVANGNYIARMDADDISFTKRLEKQFNKLKNKDLDMVFTKRININNNNNIIGKINLPTLSVNDIERILPLINFITHSSVMIKKNVIETLDKYREIDTAEDYDLWLRMIKKNYKIGLVDEFLIYYRIRNAGISQSNRYKQIVTNRFLKKCYYENELFSKKTRKKLNDYLKKNGCFNENKVVKFNEAYFNLEKGLRLFKKFKFYDATIKIFKSLISHRLILSLIINRIHYRILFLFINIRNYITSKV